MRKKQPAYPAPVRNRSQCSAILSRLKAARGAEVSLFELFRASGGLAVATRVSNLREKGHNIECRTEHIRGTVHSFYRLIPPAKKSSK